MTCLINHAKEISYKLNKVSDQMKNIFKYHEALGSLNQADPDEKMGSLRKRRSFNETEVK